MFFKKVSIDKPILTGIALGLSTAFAMISIAVAATNHTVIEKNKTFSAKKLEIAVGDTVSFINEDKIKHNVLIRKMKFDSGLKAQGEKRDVQFSEAGKFKVRCAIHPKMKMTVIVK